MAYNPYNAINEIYNLKGQWDSANNAGDETKKNEAAAKAQAYYNQLKSNGYTNVANQLSASDYASAKAIRDKYYTLATSDKTKTRPYLYSLGAKYGMSSSDVDKLISYDDVSGQVSFGGKVIGTPDSVVDGTSYWNDASVLDNAFNDYASRSGLTRTNEQLSSQSNEQINSKINQLWDRQASDHSGLTQKYVQEYEDLKNTNPFTTDEARAILAKYDLAGLQGRDNAVASGSGSNGGNIDSYAAANALRQQTALVSQGQDKVLSAYQQKLDNARAILDGLGVSMQNDYAGMQNTIGLQQNEAQRLFENNETAKNNDVARKSEIASVSGYTPDEWVVSNNPYLNDDGTLKDEYKNIDFSAVMANAKAAGNTEAYNAAATARYYKIMGDYGAYGQYDDGNYIVPGAKQTEAARQFDEQIAAADRQLNADVSMNAANNASAEKINSANNQNAIDQITTAAKTGTTTSGKPTLTASQAATAIKNGEVSQAVIDAYNYYYGTNYTVDNPPKADGASASWADDSGGDNGASETDYQAALDKVYDDSSKTVKSYIRNVLEPLIKENTITETELKENLLANSKEYDLEVKDLKAICTALGVDAKWADNYTNAGLFNWGSGVKEK